MLIGLLLSRLINLVFYSTHDQLYRGGSTPQWAGSFNTDEENVTQNIYSLQNPNCYNHCGGLCEGSSTT